MAVGSSPTGGASCFCNTCTTMCRTTVPTSSHRSLGLQSAPRVVAEAQWAEHQCSPIETATIRTNARNRNNCFFHVPILNPHVSMHIHASTSLSNRDLHQPTPRDPAPSTRCHWSWATMSYCRRFNTFAVSLGITQQLNGIGMQIIILPTAWSSLWGRRLDILKPCMSPW